MGISSTDLPPRPNMPATPARQGVAQQASQPAWRPEIAHAQRCVAPFENLGTTVPLQDEGEEIAVREVLVHMIEEYARPCSHADFLRERIDGRVGQ